jgi:hypothetical protein
MAGTVTYTHPAGEAAPSAFASGKVVTDGNATNVLCGFQPSRIELWYEGVAGANAIHIWFKGETAGDYFNIAAAGTFTFEDDNGPIVYAGSGPDGYTEGFTIPAALCTNTDVIYWCAWR